VIIRVRDAKCIKIEIFLFITHIVILGDVTIEFLITYGKLA